MIQWWKGGKHSSVMDTWILKCSVVWYSQFKIIDVYCKTKQKYLLFEQRWLCSKKENISTSVKICFFTEQLKILHIYGIMNVKIKEFQVLKCYRTGPKFPKCFYIKSFLHLLPLLEEWHWEKIFIQWVLI